jgi:hypothetical protein
MLSAISGAISVPYGSFLRFLATCGCLQGREFFQGQAFCCGAAAVRFKSLTEHCGGQILMFFSFLSAIFVIWTLAECWNIHSKFDNLRILVETKLFSFLEWFVWSLPFFSYRYPIDRKYFYKQILNNEKEDENKDHL